jgi:hypothetical protein
MISPDAFGSPPGIHSTSGAGVAAKLACVSKRIPFIVVTEPPSAERMTVSSPLPGSTQLNISQGPATSSRSTPS